MTTIEIVANLLDNWGVEEQLPNFSSEALASMVDAIPELLLELYERFGHPVDLPVVEALAFYILDLRADVG